jgi:hypothetical protein
MKLLVLVHQVVSLRIEYGKYEDSSTIRNKLTAQTVRSILRRGEINNVGAPEEAQNLLDFYKEMVTRTPTFNPMVALKPGATIRPSV